MKPYRVLNITHNDLDGIAAGLAIRLAHTSLDHHVKTVFTGYDTLHEELYRGLTDKVGFDRIILSDISPKTPANKYKSVDDQWFVKFKIPDALKAYSGEFVVLDHHAPQCFKVKDFYKPYLHPLSILEDKDNKGVPRAGSELAWKYFKQVIRPNSVDFLTQEALYKICELAGDYDTWRSPQGFGTDWAIAVELMNDCFTAMTEMENAIYAYHAHLEQDIQECLSRTLFGTYIQVARQRLETETKKAWDSKVNHTNSVTEIVIDFFPSVISSMVYEKLGGIVLIRYKKDRNCEQKISLRSHSSSNTHLGKLVSQFGGGGHHHAASLTVNASGTCTLDHLISELVFSSQFETVKS